MKFKSHPRIDCGSLESWFQLQFLAQQALSGTVCKYPTKTGNDCSFLKILKR